MNSHFKDAPIGIFDSGVGGLSVLRHIQNILPCENLLYVADSAYAPYGSKPKDVINDRIHSIAKFLVAQGVKAIVVACNTATASSIDDLRKNYTIPIVGMEPGIKPAVQVSKTKKIGILATSNTLSSNRFSQLIERFSQDAEIIKQACPGFVEAVEGGAIASLETQRLVDKLIEPLMAMDVDVLVLGCTHYPFLTDHIKRASNQGVNIIDTGAAVATHLKRVLAEKQLLRDCDQGVTRKYYTSGEPEKVDAVIKTLFPNELIKTEPLHQQLALLTA